jgi:hypothetical protein
MASKFYILNVNYRYWIIVVVIINVNFINSTKENKSLKKHLFGNDNVSKVCLTPTNQMVDKKYTAFKDSIERA